MTVRHSRLWIDGQWRESLAGRVASLVSPATGEHFGSYADSDATDGRVAVAAARRAFDESTWSRHPKLRAGVLLALAQALEGAADAMASDVSMGNGKLLTEARHEVAAGASELRYYAGLARNIFGRVTELEPGLMAMLGREPMGVAAIIVPWNAPITLLVRSLAPALAAGCTCVVKGAGQTAAATERFFQLLAADKALPRGVVNLVFESGSALAQHLVQDPEVDMISYTGSTPVGKKIMAAGASTLKRLNLELGGNAPVMVMPSADLAAAANGIVRGALSHAGQVCVAASRVIVHSDIARLFLQALTQALRQTTVGMPDNGAARMGPLISQTSRQRILELQDQGGIRAVHHLSCEVPPGLPAGGAFLTPGLIELDDEQSPLWRDEVFGPLLSFRVCDSEQDMVRTANRSSFGLAAGVWTGDLQQGQRMARELRSGTVWINAHLRLFAEIETGGYKESGLGRLHGVEGLEAFLQTKHVSWRTSDQPAAH
jgi:acyl-CoA reductase-like NAD-dependent aldehyde dehydrogenase